MGSAGSAGVLPLQRALVPFLLAAILLAPIGASTWYVNGAFEPDTHEDIETGRMFTAPDQSPSGMRVYFNAMTLDANALTLNPNVGAIGSRFLSTGRMTTTAWLGVWKDCNADGYIGMVESLVFEYKNDLLLDKSICPDGSMWNHHTWVSEFIHIGPDNQPPNSVSFPRLFTDYEADVWGDFGRPDRPDEIHYDCRRSTFPQGTFDSTGGMLVALDCQLGYNVAENVNTWDETLGLGLAFEDPVHPDRDCDHPLNIQFNTYGNSYCEDEQTDLLDGNAGDPMFTVWDCTNGPTSGNMVDVRDPTAPEGGTGSLSQVNGFGITDDDGTYGWRPIEGNEDGGIYLQVRNIAPAAPTVDDPESSLFEGYQRAIAPRCDGPVLRLFGNDNYGLGENFLGVEAAGSTNPTDGKLTADFNMRFSAPCCLGTHQGYPSSAGLRGVGRGPWNSTASYGPPTYLGGTVRSEDLMPASGIWFTFYARVGSATLARGVELPPSASTAIYGAEACGSNDRGVHNGWACDDALWSGQAVPGAMYQLRDTDCYDGEILGGSGLYASGASAADDPPCPYVAPS